MANRSKNSVGLTDLEALGIICEALERVEEPKRLWVLQTAVSRMGAGVQDVAGGPSSPPGSVPTPLAGLPSGATTSVRNFIRVKRPASDVQHVACLAYFLTHQRQQPEFKKKDIEAVHRESGGPSMDLHRALDNATRFNGYLSPVGGGKKQISTKGEDVVAALPDQEAVKQLENDQPARKRKSRRARRKA